LRQYLKHHRCRQAGRKAKQLVPRWQRGTNLTDFAAHHQASVGIHLSVPEVMPIRGVKAGKTLISVGCKLSTLALATVFETRTQVAMPLSIKPTYAVPLVLLFIALSVRVILYRRGNRVALGDAGDRTLLMRIRAHGNCAEYAPLGLLLLLMAELSGGAPVGLHLAGFCLLIGRIVHSAHLSFLPTRYTLRVVATVLTFTSYLGASAAAIL
jgi:uncharacterized protein